MINQKDIQKIEKTIGYCFRDKSLLIQAFTRTSFVNEASQSRQGNYQSNEVLEFLGDSVLSLAIITKLLSEKARRYSHGLFTELNEGDFSNIKSHLSDKRNLSRSMDALGLARYLVMGEGDKVSRTFEQPSVKEDLFESIIGAVYLDSDGDLKAITASLERMLDITSYTKGTATGHSAKGALQEWCQDKKRRLPMPRYETKSESGPAHQRVFVRVCLIGERICAEGSGKNCSEADARAAEATLALLKKEETLGDVGADIDRDAQTKLRNYAAKNKLPYPEFRDLGESPKSTATDKIYMIECRFLGKSTVSEGVSKSDARMLSASEMLVLIGEKKAKPSKSGTIGDVKQSKQQKPAVKRAAAEKSAPKKADANKPKPTKASKEKPKPQRHTAKAPTVRAYHKKG